MKVVFDNLANFLSISPNQTPIFAVCLPGPSWKFLPFLFLLILYSLPYMYTLHNVHVFTPTGTVQYVISCAVNLWLQLHTCFLTMRSKHASSEILNDIGRNSLLGNRKKIAKFLMRTFTCRSTFLYGCHTDPPSYTAWRNRFLGIGSWAYYEFKNLGSGVEIMYRRTHKQGNNDYFSRSFIFRKIFSV